MDNPLIEIATVGSIGLTVMLIMQWIKQFPWWKNGWCRVVAPLLGMVIAVGDVLVRWYLGRLSDACPPANLYDALLAGFNSGMAAVLGYDLQKRGPLVIFPPGPDNHPADRTTAAEKEGC